MDRETGRRAADIGFNQTMHVVTRPLADPTPLARPGELLIGHVIQGGMSSQWLGPETHHLAGPLGRRALYEGHPTAFKTAIFDLPRQAGAGLLGISTVSILRTAGFLLHGHNRGTLSLEGHCISISAERRSG